MARSLDKLVDFVLDEIALNGQQGASLQDVICYTKQFHSRSQHELSPSHLPQSTPTTLDVTFTGTERSLISQLWTKLSSRDDLIIGEHDKYKTCTFDQVEHDSPNILASVLATQQSSSLQGPRSHSEDGSTVSQPTSSHTHTDGPRITASNDLIWLAVCGHTHDTRKVPEKEYELLCAISATRSNGILQGDLRRFTGQDKRSVPKRTDALHEKGYIEKQTIYTKGHKTSRLYLRRFVLSDRGRVSTDELFTLQDLVQQILVVLKNNSFTGQERLAWILGIVDPAQNRVLDQLVRYLIDQGYLKEVYVTFSYDSSPNGRVKTLRIEREPEIDALNWKEGHALDLRLTMNTAITLLPEAPESMHHNVIEKPMPADSAQLDEQDVVRQSDATYNRVSTVAPADTSAAVDVGQLGNLTSKPGRFDPGLPKSRRAKKQKDTTLAKTKRAAAVRATGKPPKFMEGTDEYWTMFFEIKQAASGSRLSKSTKAGPMSDSDCLEVFTNRPERFDETLVRALEQDLPVPATAQGVSNAWVDKMNAFFDRKQPGVFYAPSGISDLRKDVFSCHLVIKSNRLVKISGEKSKAPTSVLFLSSSVAHSFRIIRLHSPQQSTKLTNVVEEVLPSPKISVLAKRQSLPDELDHDYMPLENGLAEMEPKSSKPKPKVKQRTTKKKATSTPRPETAVGPDQNPQGHSFSSTQGKSRRVRRPTQKAMESALMSVLDSPGSNSSSEQEETSPRLLSVQLSIEAVQTLRSPKARSMSVAANESIEAANTSTSTDPVPSAGIGRVLTNGYGGLQDITPNNTNDTSPIRAIQAQQLRSEMSPNLMLLDGELRPPSERTFGHDIPPLGIESKISCSSTPANQSMHETETPASNSHRLTVSLDSDIRNVEPTITSPRADDLRSKSVTPPALRASGTSLGSDIQDIESERNITTPGTMNESLELLVGGDATPYYRKILMELVEMCGGVVPNDASLLKRAMGPKCAESLVEVNMNIKLIKSNINVLIQRGKLKVMHFAYQRNGFNYTKSILAIPSTQPEDRLLLALQRQISSLPIELDYVPPELEEETARKPQGILRTLDTPHPEEELRKAVAAARQEKKQVASQERSERSVAKRRTSHVYDALKASLTTGFLTLKVPKIAQVVTDKTFTSNYYDLPAQPPVISNSELDSSTGLSTQRGGVREAHLNTSARNVRKVQWRIPKRTPLPKSLRAIVTTNQQATSFDHTLSVDPALEAFDRDVDIVAMWEKEKVDDLQDQKLGEWNFINHLSSKKDFIGVKRESDLQFLLVEYSEAHELNETQMPEAGSWDVFAEIVAKETIKSKKALEISAKRKRKLRDEPVNIRDDGGESSEFMSSGGEEPPRKRQRGPGRRWRRKPRVAGTEHDRRRQKRPELQARGVGLRDVPKAMAHRVMVAIVVVKVLTGGLEKHLDWKLIQRLIPEEPESLLQSRWRTLSTRYNNDFDAMVQDLQIKYLDALADNRVPSVNYDDLSATDWERIFEWALVNISANNRGAPMVEIPPSREEFLELNTIEVKDPAAVRNLHNSSLQYTQGTKEDILCAVVFGTPASGVALATPKTIEPRFIAEEEEADIVLARARSWAFAAVITPSRSFNAHLAHEKLCRLAEEKQECERLIESALKKLQADKMVVTKDSTDAVIESDGTTLSGTYEWKLSNKFVDRFELNRFINSTMLKQAVKYKIEVLDVAFTSGQSVIIPGNPLIEDGIMIAIFNLMDMGMLRLEAGDDMPNHRYGIDPEGEGYKTRSMDKNGLFFSTVLTPSSSYVHGDLSLSYKETTRIPRGDMNRADGLGLIPVWFDINHVFQADIWDMTVGAITGLISCRPGVSSIELVRALGYVLSHRDVEMIIEYLLECQVVERTSTGLETTETWWFAVGTGTQNNLEHGS